MEHIEDQSGVVVPYDPVIHTFVTAQKPVFYAGYESIPNLSMHSNRLNYIYVKNVSNRVISFFWRPTFHNNSTGLEVPLSPENWGGVFSNTNSPKNDGGATMQPNTLGSIEMHVVSQPYQGNASIYWDSSVCGEKPALVTVDSFWYQPYSGGRGGITNYFVNDGKPF